MLFELSGGRQHKTTHIALRGINNIPVIWPNRLLLQYNVYCRYTIIL